jgi:hypothetical protein
MYRYSRSLRFDFVRHCRHTLLSLDYYFACSRWAWRQSRQRAGLTPGAQESEADIHLLHSCTDRNSYMTSLDDFAVAVRSYCDWAKSAPATGTAKSEMLAARRHLSSLYAMAVNFPPYDCDWVERDLTDAEWSMTFKRFGELPVGYYGSLLNPLEVPAGEAALGDLADDLADIWCDLKEGLIIFDEGYRDAAGWQWLESFTMHWGEHAASALAVIHFWLGQNRYRD